MKFLQYALFVFLKVYALLVHSTQVSFQVISSLVLNSTIQISNCHSLLIIPQFQFPLIQYELLSLNFTFKIPKIPTIGQIKFALLLKNCLWAVQSVLHVPNEFLHQFIWWFVHVERLEWTILKWIKALFQKFIWICEDHIVMFQEGLKLFNLFIQGYLSKEKWRQIYV